MIYCYRNRAGRTREVTAPMKNPPPEVLRFTDGATHECFVGCHPAHPDAWIRDWGSEHHAGHVRWEPDSPFPAGTPFKPGAV